MSPEKLPLSVIVLTFNEEQNIGPCLESIVSWAQEIFVIDSGSTDRTLDIASKYGYTMITGWNGFAFLAEIVDIHTNELIAKGVVKNSDVHFVEGFCIDVKEWKFVKVDSYITTVTAKEILDELGDKCEIKYVNGEFHAYLKPYSDYICSFCFKSLDDKFDIQNTSALWPYLVK